MFSCQFLVIPFLDVIRRWAHFVVRKSLKAIDNYKWQTRKSGSAHFEHQFTVQRIRSYTETEPNIVDEPFNNRGQPFNYCNRTTSTYFYIHPHTLFRLAPRNLSIRSQWNSDRHRKAPQCPLIASAKQSWLATYGFMMLMELMMTRWYRTAMTFAP